MMLRVLIRGIQMQTISNSHAESHCARVRTDGSIGLTMYVWMQASWSECCGETQLQFRTRHQVCLAASLVCWSNICLELWITFRLFIVCLPAVLVLPHCRAGLVCTWRETSWPSTGPLAALAVCAVDVATCGHAVLGVRLAVEHFTQDNTVW